MTVVLHDNKKLAGENLCFGLTKVEGVMAVEANSGACIYINEVELIIKMDKETMYNFGQLVVSGSILDIKDFLDDKKIAYTIIDPDQYINNLPIKV